MPSATCHRCSAVYVVDDDGRVLHALYHLEETLMTKIADLASDIVALDGSVTTLITAFEALKAAVAAGGTTLSAEDQAAVDAADAEVQAIKQRADAEEAPAPTPPAADGTAAEPTA